MVGGAGSGEKLRNIRWTRGIEALEDSLCKMEFFLEDKADKPSSQRAVEAEENLHL